MSIIEVKNLGKKYNIGERQGYVALRDVLTNIARAPARWFGSKVQSIMGASEANDFWALRDINFTVEQGEVLGIIGRNGAGKSTLLKILSRITPPTTGEIKLRGRVGSLLEVGTGFHPELTGRENIYLNGAILGMRKKEIESKFDEIVEFSGIEKFLDTPVKRYSSGMYVRLAFSVAAHLEPDILIIDEVLAVGDAEFQNKCLGKMDEVTKKEGRTVLFVSHNMGAVQNLCKRCLLINSGMVEQLGATNAVVANYLNKNHSSNAVIEYPVLENKNPRIYRVSVIDKNSAPSSRIPFGENFSIKIEYEVLDPVKNVLFSVMFYSGGEMLLYTSESDKKGAVNDYDPGHYCTTVQIPASLFNVGNYSFDIALHTSFVDLETKNNINFEILDINNPRSNFRSNYLLGKFALPLDFKTFRN